MMTNGRIHIFRRDPVYPVSNCEHLHVAMAGHYTPACRGTSCPQSYFVLGLMEVRFRLTLGAQALSHLLGQLAPNNTLTSPLFRHHMANLRGRRVTQNIPCILMIQTL